MKKIIILCVVIASLAGCSTYNSLLHSFDSVSVDPDATYNNPDEEGISEVGENSPTATISLDYKKDTSEIVTQIVTQWNDAPQGSVYLQWNAPKDSKCYGTTFPITKINDGEDIYSDNQSVLSGDNVCQGQWQAEVIYKADNSVLAKSTIDVK